MLGVVSVVAVPDMAAWSSQLYSVKFKTVLWHQPTSCSPQTEICFCLKKTPKIGLQDIMIFLHGQCPPPKNTVYQASDTKDNADA